MECGGQGLRSYVWIRQGKVTGAWWSRVKVICTDKEGEWSMVVRGRGHLQIRQG